MAEVAFVTFDGFYAASLARAQPELRGVAVAVVRDRAILDASRPARQAGIRPGMTYAEARYAARGTQTRFFDYREEDYQAVRCKWLDVCAEFTTVIEPVEPHCAFLDLSLLAGARELAVPMSADIYSAIRLCPRIGVAGSRLTARLAAERGAGVVPAGQDAHFLSRLPISYLWPARPDHLRRLGFLGYRTIGDVAALPQELLHRQFGQAGIQLSLWAKGADREPVRALYPPDEISTRFYFPQPARLDAEIEAGLRVLSQRLGAILQIRDKQARTIELEVVFEEDVVQRTKRAFTKKMQSPGSLLTGLRLTLRTISIETEVCSIYARLPEICDSDRGQMDLLGASERETAVSNIHLISGIQVASEVAVSRRKQLLKAMEDAACEK